MSCVQRRMKFATLGCLPLGAVLILSLAGAAYGETTSAPEHEIKSVSSSQATQTPEFIHSTEQTVKLLDSTVELTTSTTKEGTKTTKAYGASESLTTPARLSTTRVHKSTKGVLKSARRQKLNTSSSALGATPRFQERLGAIDCDLPVLPNESRLWRGNETHELNLPVTVSLIIIDYELYELNSQVSNLINRNQK